MSDHKRRRRKRVGDFNRKKIIAESRVSAEATLVNARKQLEAEQQAAMSIFKKEASALVLAASGRLLGREIKGEDSKHYADMLLGEISLNSETSSLTQADKN